MSNSRKKNVFTHVPVPNVRRNLFDLSHEVKMSGKFGYLYPVLLIDTLPGDTIRDKMNVLLRFAPLSAPVMHRCDVTAHFFFVPNRLLTDHWEMFITGGQDGTESVVLPYITPSGVATGVGGNPDYLAAGSVWDYFGLPVHVGGAPAGGWSTEQVSVLPFRALAKVWNDYYRDPNLTEEIELNLSAQGSQNDPTLASGMLDIGTFRRGFEKDYFTSALPWAQRGAQVLMPLTGSASVNYKDISEVYDNLGDPTGQTGDLRVEINDNQLFLPAAGVEGRIENIDSIELDGATTTINDFRRALAIQKWLEANARGGARYTEQILGHFNVQVPDYRLQRAEYLGGGRQPVQISEVLSMARTEVTGGDTEVGSMFGHGISVGSTNRFTYRCQEHGWVIGVLSVTLRTAYSQGLARKFRRHDKFDFAWPELAHLGEQEIASKEVFFSFDLADDVANDGVFGYIPRYSEYKFENDRIAGDFRGTLNFWHLGRRFTERPSLDEAFTTLYEDGDGGSGVPSDLEESFRRIFQVNDGTDYLWMQLYHHLTAKRPLPYFGVPRII